MHLITSAYPAIVAATQAPAEEEPQPSFDGLKDLEYPGDKRIKKPLSVRKIGLPYQWNPEKRELRSSIEGIRLFCHQQLRLVDSVQSLILENTKRQGLEDTLLEPFRYLSQLTLKGAFENLAFVRPIQDGLSHLVLWNTRLPFQEISFLTRHILLQTLDLGRNAFLRPGKSTFIESLFFENLKSLKLDVSMSWLLDCVKAASFPQLQSVDLKLDTLKDRELKLLAECKHLKVFNLGVNQMILLTRVAPAPSSSITTLGLTVPGFINADSFQAFLTYFPRVETLHLEGACQHVSVDSGIYSSCT